MSRQYIQEFRNQDSGKLERITSEPLEYWTAEGWEIIPAGFKCHIPERLSLTDNEIKSLILYQWHITAKNKPQRAAVRILRANLIKYPRKQQNAIVAHFWRFVKERARAEVLIFLASVALRIAQGYLK